MSQQIQKLSELQKVARSMGLKLSSRGKAFTRKELADMIERNVNNGSRYRKYELITAARKHGVNPYDGGRLKTKKALMDEISRRANLRRVIRSECKQLEVERDRLREELDFANDQLKILYEKYSKLQMEA
jgi:predicted nuclease with TOPRIM domain